ncbi:hypothetical protein ACIBI0_33440 [Microbispora rosea]|uniref:hypothetical protein n=1 Tax=Microbispora rosea TaxID=58117 RepID=UPI00378FAD67
MIAKVDGRVVGNGLGDEGGLQIPADDLGRCPACHLVARVVAELGSPTVLVMPSPHDRLA